MTEKDEKRQKAMELLESLDSMDLLLMMQELKAMKAKEQAKQPETIVVTPPPEPVNKDLATTGGSIPPKAKPVKVNTGKKKKELVPGHGPRRGVDKKASKNFGRTESMRIGPRVNLFEESEDYYAHKEDVEIDKKLCIKKPVPRMRELNLVDVECSECGKEESVSAVMLGTDITWKCNDCARNG
jgi:hypothetical protein